MATENQRNWQSVRAMLEAAILAVLLWSGKTQLDLVTQVAVLQNTVRVLGQQLSTVPNMNVRLSRLELQAERNRQDIAELRQMQGLK